MGIVEMVGLMDRQRLSRFQACADRTGTGAPFGPLRAEIKPGLSQAVVEERVSKELHGHAFPVGEKQHVVLPGNLAEQVLQPRASDADQVLRLLPVFLEPGFRHDIGFATLGRVEPVMLEAAHPGFHDRFVAADRKATANALNFADMFGM